MFSLSLFYHKKMPLKWQYLPVNLLFRIADKIPVQHLITDKRQILKIVQFHLGNCVNLVPRFIRYTLRTDRDIYSGYIIEFEGVFVTRGYFKKLRNKKKFLKKNFF